MKWTEERLAYVRQNYGSMTAKQIASEMGCSVGVVAVMASRMGVKSNGKKWTSEQAEDIRQHYGKEPTSEIAKRIGKTEDAIRQRARGMGLKAPSQLWSDYAENYLIDCYGIEPIKDISKHLKRTVAAIRRKARLLGITCCEVGTLCWSCQNASCGCSWSRWYEPVDGWDAEKTIILSGNEYPDIESYLVKKCPEYIKDRKRGYAEVTD